MARSTPDLIEKLFAKLYSHEQNYHHKIAFIICTNLTGQLNLHNINWLFHRIQYMKIKLFNRIGEEWRREWRSHTYQNIRSFVSVFNQSQFFFFSNLDVSAELLLKPRFHIPAALHLIHAVISFHWLLFLSLSSLFQTHSRWTWCNARCLNRTKYFKYLKIYESTREHPLLCGRLDLVTI